MAAKNCAGFLLQMGALTLLLTVGRIPAADPQTRTVVRLEANRGAWQLLRNGQPFYIRGAGGDASLELLGELGGNSIRTWGIEGLQERLDEAQRQGLMVCVGIWLGHERHGFDYSDAEQVARQREEVQATILKYRDHPAVLLWGLGNEMEGFGKGDNTAIWTAVNDLAKMVKKLDPHHPTMTVVAEIGGDRVKNIHELCPAIDIIGINSYGGATSIARRYRKAGGTKPYVVTEFGTPGPWEVGKAAWGAPLEPTSTQKATPYKRSYEAFAKDTELCLGSYAFLWGHKQEATATWFGMLLPNGDRLAAADTMSALWTGKDLSNHCPAIGVPQLVGPSRVEPKTVVEVKLSVSDSDGDLVRVRWVLQADPGVQNAGGDAQPAPETFPSAIITSTNEQVKVRMPDCGGPYRLFAYASDGKGGAAVANVPLFVNGPARASGAQATTLPLVIYDEAERAAQPYAPSGWMGNRAAMKLDLKHSENPHAGKTCIRIDYSAADEWSGIAWQHPDNDWGDQAGGWNLTGAKQLSFWLRGSRGGEIVKVEFGILGTDKKFSDTGNGKLEGIKLTTDWVRHTIPLEGKDLSRIKTGLVITFAGQGQPLTIFLDDCVFE